MAKVKYIPCDIYKRGISIFIGSLKEFKAWVKMEYTDGTDKGFAEMVEKLDEDNVGMASFNYNNQDGQPERIRCVGTRIVTCNIPCA